MINQKELRIGNYVRDLWQDDQVNNIIELTPFEFKVRVINMNCDKLESIVLTPELLEMCGIKKYFDQDGITEYKFDSCYDGKTIGQGVIHNDLDSYGFRYFVHRGLIPKKLEYLHQLQNLFFEINGIELNIQLAMYK